MGHTTLTFLPVAGMALADLLLGFLEQPTCAGHEADQVCLRLPFFQFRRQEVTVDAHETALVSAGSGTIFGRRINKGKQSSRYESWGHMSCTITFWEARKLPHGCETF
jgi:hypothetical protein